MILGLKLIYIHNNNGGYKQTEKDDLKRLGFSGKVVDMKKELSAITKKLKFKYTRQNRKWTLRNENMATLKMKLDDYAITQERIEKGKLESSARQARRIEVATRLSNSEEINKVRPELVRKGINPEQ